MSQRQELITRRLEAEGQKTASYFRGLDPAAFEQAVYTTGPGWRVRDVLAHLVSAERTFAYYGRDILAGGQGAPEDFVIDEFNAAQVAALNAATPPALVEAFEAARAETTALAAGMAEADLDRVGRHPFFGTAPLEQMLKLIYRHTMLHERDVRRALAAGAPVPHGEAVPPTNTQAN